MGMEQLSQLQQGMRRHGDAWLQRSLRSLKKQELTAIAECLDIVCAGEVVKNDLISALLTKIQCAERVFQLQRLVAESGLACLREKLGEFRVLELKKMTEQIGLPSGGLKEELIAKLFDHISLQDCV